ncbi:hypothetical protein [Enterococcus italicus]|uniref:hypothetical protein n=1 Tax=Enterococcus italicus TaxID=246144 RepID=UPI003F4460A9
MKNKFYEEILTEKEKVFTSEEKAKWSDSEKALREWYEQKCYTPNVSDLYDDLKKGKGRIPTKEEYMKQYCKISYDYIKLIKKMSEKEDYIIKRAIYWRAERCYKSYIAEEYFMQKLREFYPTCELFHSQLIDKVFGVDIVAAIDNRFYYIHVTKDTSYSISRIAGKEKQTKYKFNNKWFEYERDFSNHMILTYNVNKFEELTKEKIDKMLEENGSADGWFNNELIDFNKQMIVKKVVNKSFKFQSENGRKLEMYQMDC